MKKYVLYDTGWVAENFIYEFEEKDEIAYCIDKNKTGEFYGYPIYTLQNAPNLEEYMILVAAIGENYKQIKSVLIEKGLREFENFIYAEAIHKKIAVVHGNCYSVFYKRYLLQSKSFSREYVIWNVPQIQLNREGCLDDALLQQCDLYIHQDIQAENKFGYQLSDEYILPRLKKGCKTITVPNLVGMGKWSFPTVGGEERRVSFVDGGGTTMFFRDQMIEDAYKSTKNLAEIKEYICLEDVFSQEKIRELFKECMTKLKEREANWDVKISDYILQNYQKRKMFFDTKHPTTEVMNVIGQRLCELLNLTDVDTNPVYPLNWQEGFMPECVKCALEINFEETYIREEGDWKNKLGTKQMDLEEYIRQYIWWFHGECLQ